MGSPAGKIDNVDVSFAEGKSIAVLAVDDELSMLKLYRRFLCSTGGKDSLSEQLQEKSAALFGGERAAVPPCISFEVTTCRQGPEAVEAVERACESGHPFSVVFLDVRMPPGPDGLWTAERIRKLDAHVNIVIVTAFSDTTPGELTNRVPPPHRILYMQKPIHASETQQLACSLGAKWFAERRLEETNKRLEAKVAERVKDLTRANEQLRAEMADRARAEKALRESEERYRCFVTEFQGIAFQVQADWIPLFFHGAVEHITGYTEQEFLNGDVSLAGLVVADDKPEFAAAVDYLRNTCDHVGPLEFRISTKQGETKWVQASLAGITSSSGGSSVIQGTLHDITQLKEMQQRVAQTERLAVIGEMSAQVAHEIKNPLAGIGGAVQVLRQRLSDSDPHVEVMDEIVAQVQRVDSTVRSLLSFARPLQPEKLGVDIRELVDDLWYELQKRDEFSDMTLVFTGAAGLEAEVDPELLRHAVSNLIENARQAMDGEGRIVCDLQDHRSMVAVTFIDEGPGIPDAMAGRLFKPFATTKTRGTGLGLAIARRIIEAHGGKIELANEPGRGARATIWFPKE